MSIQSAGKLAYLIPSQNLEFDTTLFRLFDLLKMICIGTITGETLVYRYSTSTGKFVLIPKLILLPDPRQKTGAVRDIAIGDSLYEEIICSTHKVIVTLHEDNRLRTWNILDGKCMCVSLPNLFSTKIEHLQSTRLQRYISCVGANCSVYLLDIITMEIVKIYSTSDMGYKSHLYLNLPHALWLLDSHNSLFFWKLADHEDVKAIKKYNRGRTADNEVPKHVNPLPVAVLPKEHGLVKGMVKVGDKDILILFDQVIYLVQDLGAQPGQEVKNFAKSIEGLEGDLISANIIDRQKLIVFISNKCKMYYVALKDLLEAEDEVKVKMVVSLKGYKNGKFTPKCHVLYTFSERYVLAIPGQKQAFYSWELAALEKQGCVELNATAQKPWKKLASSEKSQVRINTFIDTCNLPLSHENLAVLEDNETVTASIIHSLKNLSSPLYIVATNKGNIYIFKIFMSDSKSISPVLKVEGHKSPINHLCVKRSRLLAASADGSLSITDLTPEKLNRAYEKYFSQRKDGPLERSEKYMQQYKDITSHIGLIPSGVAGFLEIHSLSEVDQDEGIGGFQLVEAKSGNLNGVFEENIGISGRDNSVLIVSLSTLNITHTYKGHDSTVVGLYLNERTNSLLVLTDKATTYAYSMASRVLERKTTGLMAYNIFNLGERVGKVMAKEEPKYGEIFKSYMSRDMMLKKGCHKTLDFCQFMEMVQTDWRNPGSNKETIYRTACKEVEAKENLQEPLRNKEVQLKAFNTVANLKSKVNAKYEPINEVGFTSIQVKMGSKDYKTENAAKEVNKAFKDDFEGSAKSNVIVISLEDLLTNLQRNYKVENKGPIFSMFDRNSPRKKEEEKKSPTAIKKIAGVLSSVDSYKSRSDVLWPLPLMSLIHSFGINKKVDKDLGEEFCICPPVLQLWVGVPGVEGTFSFTIPEVFDTDWTESQGLYNWKVSPYINSAQCMMLFASLVTIFHFNEQFIASMINRLLGTIAQFLAANKALPYISFMKLSGFLNSKDPDVWSTSRDIILRPFLKKARPETFMNTTVQLSSLVGALYEKVKKEANYKKALGMLVERANLTKLDFLSIINKYFGEVELRALTVLCYTFNEHYDLAATPKTVKRCVKLICFLIGEISAKSDKSELRYVLINLLMILANNVTSLKFGLQDYIHQLFRQLIHIYATNPKAKADNIVLKIQCEKYTLTKPLNSMIQFLPSAADSAIVALAEHFNNELVEILYNEILRKDISQSYATDIIEIVRSMVRRISECLPRHLPTFANMILRAVDVAKDSSGKDLIDSVTHLIKTMLAKYQNVAFHQPTEFLAVGSVEGLIVVYALKQHQKLKVLEGHKDMISALAFNKNGGRIVSYCAKERILRLWEISSGILSFMGILSKSSVIPIDTHPKKSRLEYKGKKEDTYPKVEFAQVKKQVILYLSHEEAYVFTV